MQTVLMLIQFGTVIAVSLGAWLSLKKPRSDTDAAEAPKKDVKTSMSLPGSPRCRARA